jgi:hypothetical protein
MDNQDDTESKEYHCSLCDTVFDESEFLTHFKICEICYVYECGDTLQTCHDCEEVCCKKCFRERNLCIDCTPTCKRCETLLLYDQDQDSYDLMWFKCQLCDSLTYYLCRSCATLTCETCQTRRTVCFRCQETKDICPHSQAERDEQKRKQAEQLAERQQKRLADQSDICRPS